MKMNAREIACQVLRDVEEKGAFSNIKLNEQLVSHPVSAVDRGFITELVYGVLRFQSKIDYCIQRNIMFRMDELSPAVLTCLRTAIYQLYYMDRVPDFAVVSEAVKIVRQSDPEKAGFVNGVLRNILRNRGEFDEIKIHNKLKRLAVEYSHPEWIVRKFIPLFGEAFVIEWMKYNNKPAELTARVNTLRCSREELIPMLEAEGFHIRTGFTKDGILLKGHSKITESEWFQKGFFFLQDESSMVAAAALNPTEGSCVIDLCSAPGGKATHLAQMMNNQGRILAFDIYDHKLELIQENAHRLGVSIIEAKKNDAVILSPELVELADFVLVDAPCSGIGLFQKKPEIKWNLKEEHIIDLCKLQRDILKNAIAYLKPGGVMVYSTCTLTIEENEEMVEWILSSFTNIKLEPVRPYLPLEVIEKASFHSGEQDKDRGMIKLFPHIYSCDGFFIARFRKEV